MWIMDVCETGVEHRGRRPRLPDGAKTKQESKSRLLCTLNHHKGTLLQQE